MQRSSTVVLAIALATMPLFVAGPSAANALVPTHLVFGATSAAMALEGILVVDEYGAFASVAATEHQAAMLRSKGYALMTLNFAVGRGAYAVGDEIPVDLKATDGNDRFILQFRGPIKREWLNSLEATATDVHDYLPAFAYLVRHSSTEVTSLLSLPGVRLVEPYHPAFKLSPSLAHSGNTSIHLVAFPDADVSALHRFILSRGGEIESTLVRTHEVVVRANLAAEVYADLARRPDVAWIEPAPLRTTLAADQAIPLVLSNTTDGPSRIHTTFGIDGSSQKMVICDSGLQTAQHVQGDDLLIRPVHPAFNDSDANDPEVGLLQFNAHLDTSPRPLPTHRRVDLYYAPQEEDALGQLITHGDAGDNGTGHGSGTAGIAGGDDGTAGSWDSYDGGAYRARLYICDVTKGDDASATPAELADDWNYVAPAYARGARVASFSFGSQLLPPTTTYTEEARKQDLLVWERRDLSIVRSAGNAGESGMSLEAIAKNVVTVGATENKPTTRDEDPYHSSGNLEAVWNMSSRGNTSDFRIKPNVVAPGACVTAAAIRDGQPVYTCVRGTSFATPAVAAAAVLIRDYFHKGFYPTGEQTPSQAVLNVSAALVRAMLHVSARDITGNLSDNDPITGLDPTPDGESPTPNGDEGWGRVLLDDVLYFKGDSRKLLVVDAAQTLDTGMSAYYNITAGSGVPLRVVLAWTDFPATLGTTEKFPILVNNLNLYVHGPVGAPGAATYVGNAWNGNETDPADSQLDPTNVEEGVYITLPSPGTYRIRVDAVNVATSEQQDYALAITGDVAWATAS